MSKTSVFTTITPLPGGITRQSVLDTYHNHIEMIELNPLVVERFKCKPPSYSPAEEFYSTWYTIKDKVSYLPGNLATGSVSYHAVFHDLPDGLQTHVYAPLGLDIRAKWSVGGSLPGEPKVPMELGIGAPASGLYIREDVRMKCNIMMLSFVKKTFKESHAKLVDRLVEKAHAIESNFANERLKALKEVDPGERMGHGDIFIAPPPGYQSCAHPEHPNGHPGHRSVYSNGSNSSPMHSPGLSQASTLTAGSGGAPSFLSSPPQQYASPHVRTHSGASFQFGVENGQQKEPQSLKGLSYLPATTYNPHQRQKSREDVRTSGYAYHAYQPPPTELPGDQGPPVPPKEYKYAAELPG